MTRPAPRTAMGRARVRRFGARRRGLAETYLSGDGIEIGALHLPLEVPAAARVRYVDRYDVDGLRRHYAELADLPLVPVDVIDDGERLGSFADASLDFVIANHFIEHTQDPLATLQNHLRVLRPAGVLFLGVPDRRRGIDAHRDATPLEHVIRDFEEGPGWSRAEHYRDWAARIDRAVDVDAQAAALMDADYSIHFHVWDRASFRALLEHARDGLGLPLSIEALRANGTEFIAVLRRTT